MTNPPSGRLRRYFGHLYQRFISLQGPPDGIARGVAIGVFIAFSPLLGLHSILCAALCLLLRANLPAAFLASWLANPIVFPLLLFLDYEVGRFVIGSDPIVIQWRSLTRAVLWAHAKNLLVPLLLGSLVCGLAAALPSYLLSRAAIVRARAGRSAAPRGGVLP